ncbi:WecB/TagA/CpsF family glycosyltransferase [Virgibacillus siamensis]|uniref:WecB/TagA/CpsF family glycosyltransferase n=1 Tax=Virgibacillus siamensis TaxID=480071 RepID=UPI0009872F21|nr:WecB/TagA/CpsF family glycosyltransferase [Virgibacillus siamensis]
MNEHVDTVRIMNLDFINTTQNGFLEDVLDPHLQHGRKCFVVTGNPEIAMRAREDKEYRKAVGAANYVIPDGAGILIAAKYKKQPLKERVAGYDVMRDLLDYANEHRMSCYFLGATEEVNKKAVAEVERQYPHVKIAGRHHGFFALDDHSIVEEVRASGADIVFVALGLPRQEIWIAQHFDVFDKGIFMGVGGSIDVIAGEVKRAPDFWIKLNLEWLYRLLKQPFRFKRILKVAEFMLRIFFKKS